MVPRLSCAQSLLPIAGSLAESPNSYSLDPKCRRFIENENFCIKTGERSILAYLLSSAKVSLRGRY